MTIQESNGEFMSELTVISNKEIISTQNLDQNPAAVYLAGLTPTGRRSQAHALRVVAKLLSDNKADLITFPWTSLRFQHTMAIRTKLIERYKPATVNRTLCAIRGVLKAAWRLGQMSIEDYQRTADVPCVAGETLPKGRELSQCEISALINNCVTDPTLAGVRDGAIIALMYACGLRREEVVAIKIIDYDPETGRLRVLGKRFKERTAWLTNGAKQAMDEWIRVRGNEEGSLFMSINKSGRVREGKMSNQAIYFLMAKRGAMAGIKSFTPHDMRRTFVSDLLDAGADIATVAKMAGHESVNTTAHYDRRSEETKRKTAELLQIPYPTKE